MEKLFPARILKNAEFLLRLTMAVAIFTAGYSKFHSGGQFQAWYFKLLTDPTHRLQFPGWLMGPWLDAIQYVEVGLGLGLLIPRLRRLFAVLFVFHVLGLAVGHYVMEEFLEVDVVLPWVFFGVTVYVLPGHATWRELLRQARDDATTPHDTAAHQG